MSAVLELVIICDKCAAQGGFVWRFTPNPAESDPELARDEAAKMGWHYDSRRRDLCPLHAKGAAW